MYSIWKCGTIHHELATEKCLDGSKQPEFWYRDLDENMPQLKEKIPFFFLGHLKTCKKTRPTLQQLQLSNTLCLSRS